VAAKRRNGGFPHDSVEFGRVLAFSDGLFAIAMTLLVVTIVVPTVSDSDSVGELADALGDLQSNVISFFISFAVIGRYWVAHHAFFSLLKAMDTGLIGINLVYLAFIAFLPFPTALLGTYFENPLAVTIYAVSVAIVSGLEVVLFRHAHRRGLMRRRMPDEVFRWGTATSLAPVAVFALSIPIAFLSTAAAASSWLLAIPIFRVLERWKPARADEFLRG
jgi:uncharacterized membrane protein